MTERRKPRSASAADRESARDGAVERLRREIDATDRALLDSLNERARLVEQLGRIKRERGVSLYQAAREREIVAQLAAENLGPFPNAALPHVFREIISATRSLGGPLRVAYLGPEGTFCHQAARQQFGAQTRLTATASIAEIFAAVERGVADFGVVPVENTTEGAVTQALDALAESPLTICGERLLPISHHLLSRSGRREDVRRIASHPQPLAQCRRWLEQHLPGIERVETASTAVAARLAREDVGVAAIASALAAEAYGLETIEAAIADRRDNTTRFAVIGREEPQPSGDDLTSAVFTVRKDEAGTLHRLLEPFARHRVNLTAIQARPIAGKPWEYLFFIDLEGHRDDPPVAKALAEAANRAFSHRILGSFPRAASRSRGPGRSG